MIIGDIWLDIGFFIGIATGILGTMYAADKKIAKLKAKIHELEELK